MAEIICRECNTSVPKTAEYCPECGYPFDSKVDDQKITVTDKVETSPETITDISSMDIILRSLDSFRMEMNELQKSVNVIRQELQSHSTTTVENTQKQWAETGEKLESIASLVKSRDLNKLPDSPKKSMGALLAIFYKTLNSPNSMFEYMFYICIVQVVFVIVNLFLAAYIVTLVR